jgi:pimeloyl-ACP methyl ester carboxylesterase
MGTSEAAWYWMAPTGRRATYVASTTHTLRGARKHGYSRCVKPSSSGGHLPINGLQLYYEAHGELGASEAMPLLLIPGAFLSADSMKQWVAAFVAKRPVIVFDQQGHGRTADTPRTMSYEQFGDDAGALLHALEVEPADVMGYSQGGGVALQLAPRQPQLVSKLVTLSATYRQDG